MEQVNIIGIDLAKRSFQLHGARADGSVAFRRKVSREKFLYFLAALRRCVVAMEACASAHHWGREIMQFGHDVRLVPPIYVKPFVKRKKGIVKLTDCRLFSAFFHEAKPLKLRKAAIDNLPRFWSESS